MTHHGNRIETKLIARKSQQLIGQLSNYFAYVRKVYMVHAKQRSRQNVFFSFTNSQLNKKGHKPSRKKISTQPFRLRPSGD